LERATDSPGPMRHRSFDLGQRITLGPFHQVGALRELACSNPSFPDGSWCESWCELEDHGDPDDPWCELPIGKTAGRGP